MHLAAKDWTKVGLLRKWVMAAEPGCQAAAARFALRDSRSGCLYVRIVAFNF